MGYVVDEERRGPPVEIADYTITPVFRVRISASRFGTFFAVVGSKTPSGLIVKLGDDEWIVPVPEAVDDPGV